MSGPRRISEDNGALDDWRRESDDVEAAAEHKRMQSRIAEALADPTGRLKLFLNGVHSREIDDDVGRIRSLRELYLQHNSRLKRLPASLPHLRDTLRVLDASHCALTELPEELALLSRLTSLNVSHNALTSFVWAADAWPELTFLDVSANQITNFSHRCMALFARLRRAELAARRVQLHAGKTLVLFPNGALMRATDRLLLSSAPSSTNGLDQRKLANQLPYFVEQCCVCGDLIHVGRPYTYVHFASLASLTMHDEKHAAAAAAALRGGSPSNAASGVTVSLAAGKSDAQPAATTAVAAAHPSVGTASPISATLTTSIDTAGGGGGGASNADQAAAAAVGDTAEGDAAAPQGDENERKLVPFFFPLCTQRSGGTECSLRLHAHLQLGKMGVRSL